MATSCALLRRQGKCKLKFGGQYCSYCKIDIRQYVNADPREVDLFMYQAEGRAYDLHKRSRPNFLLWALGIAACLAIGWWGYLEKQSFLKLRDTPVNSPTNTSYVSTTSTSVVKDNTHEQIVIALNEVSRQMNRNIDVNKDGLTNCIDAAIIFYQAFADKSKVCIEVNYNPGQDMHHLFNCVFIDGNWRAIEPQAYWKNHTSYYMRDVWGIQYDSSKNRDVTEEYLKYVK
jgi:hypothetical protein